MRHSYIWAISLSNILDIQNIIFVPSFLMVEKSLITLIMANLGPLRQCAKIDPVGDPSWRNWCWTLLLLRFKWFIYCSEVPKGSENQGLQVTLSCSNQQNGNNIEPWMWNWIIPSKTIQDHFFSHKCLPFNLQYLKTCLVVAPPLWKMMEFVSWDDEIPNWMEK